MTAPNSLLVALACVPMALVGPALLPAQAGEAAQTETEKPLPAEAEPEKAEPEKADPLRAIRHARSLAQGLAASGGYTQRIALWLREAEGAAAHAIELQLFADNDYQVVVGFDPPTAVVSATATDARGKEIALDVHQREGKLVFQLDPARNGMHRIQLRILDPPAAPTALALTYVYK